MFGNTLHFSRESHLNVHAEAPGIVPKKSDDHLDDPEQETKPQARIGEEIELGVSALAEQFAELGTVHHHLVNDAVAQTEYCVGILLQSYRQSLQKFGVEMEENALRHAVQTSVHCGRQTLQVSRYNVVDYFLRQLGNFRRQQ